MASFPPITVLIVDDSRADTRLTQLWLRNSATVGESHVVRTGGEALAFLRREGPHAQAPTAHLLLLDVHLPDMLGWDLLAELGRDQALSRIPVIILTGTESEADAKLAGELGAARYLAKPFDADEFAILVRQIESVAAEAFGQP